MHPRGLRLSNFWRIVWKTLGLIITRSWKLPEQTESGLRSERPIHTILAISQDDRLLITRKEVLRRANSEVVAAKPEEAIELLKTRRFDLVVLCHSLTHEETVEIASMAHQQTIAIPILKVMSSLEPISEWIFVAPDAVASSDPRILIEKVAELLNVSLSRSNEEMLAQQKLSAYLAARHRDEMVRHEFESGQRADHLHRRYLRGGRPRLMQGNREDDNPFQ